MKIINGSFVNMLDELENFQQRSSSLNHGWTEKEDGVVIQLFDGQKLRHRLNQRGVIEKLMSWGWEDHFSYVRIK